MTAIPGIFLHEFEEKTDPVLAHALLVADDHGETDRRHDGQFGVDMPES